MKRSITRWTTAMAAASLFVLPSGAWAQSTAQPPASPSTPTTQSAAQPAKQANSPQEHIRQAEEALNSISATAVAGPAKTSITELKRHVSALKRAAASANTASTKGSGQAQASAARANAQWATEAAAADRILTQLLGSEATGTAGTAGGAQSKAAAAINLDADTRAKLAEARTHITAFAAGMSGSASASSPDAAATAAASAAGASMPQPTQPPTAATQPPTGSEPPAATQPPSSGSSSSGSSSVPPSATSAVGAQAPPSGSSSTASQSGVVDKEAAKQALTAARDTLSQLTQLPAAGQLTGDARTQVSQLIANFNELITTDSEWRAAYAKVEGNLTALIGAQTTDESPATPTSGTAGAVGTSGSVSGSVDPGVRAKLVELRTHLNAFQKAAGGPSSSGSSPAAASGSPANSAAAASASSAGSAGSVGATTAAASPSAAPTSAGAPTSVAADQSGVQAEALRHIAAIEAILSGNPATAAAAGTSGAAGAAGGTAAAGASGVTLDRAQLDQLRTHLNELKRLIAK